jgi:tetratricopeptide (TPR) repeat protein
MQQYRVNYRLLIILFVVGMVGAGAAYGLWLFQMERHADTLFEAAVQAEKGGDARTAIPFLASYVSFRPDDTEARVKLANSYADLTEQDDVTYDELSRALNMLEDAVRNMPEERELQTRLVKLYARVGRPRDALDHLGYMLDKYGDDSELLVMKDEYLIQAREENEAITSSYALMGYDPESDAFDVEKAKAPHSLPTYNNIAMLLRSRGEKRDLADRIINQMVETNPDSAEAYLRRGHYFIQFDEKDQGNADIAKAYALDPENAEVLLAMAEVATDKDQTEKAREYLEKGQAKFPNDNRFYQTLALLEMKSQDYQAALAHVDEGLKVIKGGKAQLLVAFKGDLQFRMNDLKGVQETIDQMREAGFRPEYISWTEARILLAQGKWYEASEALSRLRPELATIGDLSTQAGFQLGFCYEQLGRYDLARDAYNSVLQEAPDNEPAAAGMQRVLAKLGQATNPANVEEQEQSWQQLVAQELRKPKQDQDWTTIDKQIEKALEASKTDEGSQKLLWAQLYLMRGDLDKTRQLLQEAHRLIPDDGGPKRLVIQRMAIQLVLQDKEQGPEKALQLINRAINQFGDQPTLRLDKADILLGLRGERLPQQLTKLTQGIDAWNNSQKLELWNGMAPKFLAVGMADEGKQCLENIVNLQPDDLSTRRMLFMLALETNDDVGMQDAQEKILDLVKDKNDSLWQFTEARRMLSLYQRNLLGKDALPEIRHLLQKAMEQRPDWHELHLAKADLELAAGKEDLALQSFAKAEQLGPVSPNARLRFIRLLVNHGRYQQAKGIAEKFPEASRVRLLGQLYPDILFNSGNTDEALEAARELIKSDPDNAANQMWFGQFAARVIEGGSLPADKVAAVSKEAGDALKHSVELVPDSPDAWTALVTLRFLSNDQEGANEALREAQLALSEDNLTAVLARSYEILGRWFDAENMYSTTFEAHPNNVRLMQLFANFYLSRSYPQDDGVAKASSLINNIMRLGAEGKLPPNSPSLLWARRTAAKMLASTKEYPQLIKAENLLRSNAQGESLSREDRLVMARILAPRPEPVSRVKAVKLFEATEQEGRLDQQDELSLGALYFGLNQWTLCRKQMLETISRYPDWPDPRKAYTRMLLQRGTSRDLAEAEAQVKKLGQLNPKDVEVFTLAIRTASALGKKDQAQAGIKALIPHIDDPKNVTKQQIAQLRLVASLLVEIEDYDQAENIYRQLTAMVPAEALELADFLGNHRDADKSFEVLQKIYRPESAAQIIRVALGVARADRDAIGDKYDALLQQWLDRALRENPNSFPLLMLQAELYDLQQKYDDSLATYQKLLNDQSLRGQEKAIVLNNVSFMVALLGDKLQTDLDPLKLVQEAVQILGPTAAILDTRAVVYSAQGNYARAIEDIDLSLADEPTAAKYYHKVVAHLGAGQNQAALEAWDKAQELNLTVQDLDRLERDRFEGVKAKIEKLQSPNPTVSETAPLRAAG